MASIANQRGYNSYNNFPRHNNISVPSSIKCTRCGIVKSKAAFSNGSQADLVQHMRRIGLGFDPTKTAYIACMKCTPQQVVELHCYMCDKDKGLEKFFKTQRRTPDHAMCITCQQDKLNYEPGAESSDESKGSGTDDSDDSEDYSLTAGMSSMSVSGNGTFPSARSSTTGGGVALGSNIASSTAPASVNGTSSKSTISHATSRPVPSRASAASAAARYGTASRPTPSVAGTTASTRASCNWAKPKTVQRRVQYDVAQQEREEQKAKEDALDDDKEFCGGDSDSD